MTTAGRAQGHRGRGGTTGADRSAYVRSDGCHIATRDDTSPEHRTYQHGSHQGGYDPACGWCYLQARHSEAAHRQSRLVPHR
ncbi:MAG: hypothetical protein ACRDZR_02225 [Acidimicrobiales bacterium]